MVDFALDVVKATTQFVAAQAWEEISLAWGFKDHLENLKKKFLHYQNLLEVVGKEKHDVNNPIVKNWLQQVTNVAYFADDVLDDYAYEMLRRELELGKNILRKNKACTFFTISKNPLVFRFRMTHKVLEILAKFDELDKEAKKIGLKPIKIVEQSTNSSHSVDDVKRINLEDIRKNPSASVFVGREEDKKKLLEMMCSPNNDKEHLFTIAIFGLGGLGKTTLARAVYDEQKHFDNKMWVCVSEDFNVYRILKEMVELLPSEKCDLTNMDAIIQVLQMKLKGKKFLLVLDDVWKEDKALWDSLKNQLRTIEGRQGSVILVTTRSKKVATSAGVREPYELKGLSDEDSWTLFEKQVNIPTPSHKEVGHRIVKKCNGVPLAITTMGGLLQSKERIQDWESIENNEVWATSSENDTNYILPSLFLSYQHLPSLSLKQCFAYCATFPKDHIMEKNELIDLWIAQGFLTLHGTSNSTSKIEKMGEDYFKALLNISFLQLEEGHWTEYNTEKEIWKCKMHDLVHDLASHIFEKELFIWDVKADTITAFNCRHLVLFDFTEEKSKALKEEIIQQVRTMNIWSGKCPSWNVLTEARCLRTLIIVNKGITEVPPTIGKLKHLRYLDLSSNPIEILPDSVCKLYQLQALILLKTRLKELPKELCKLVNLRRLMISGCVCKHLPINDLGRLPNLRGLCLYKLSEMECVGEEVNGNENENNHINESLDTTNKGKYIDGSSLENEFFPSLTELRIRDCERLSKLNLVPPTANATTVVVPFPRLEVLEIVKCPKLEVVETSPALSFNSLRSLYLEKFGESEEPLDIIKYHKSGSLTSLIVKKMPRMKSLPQSLSNCSRLETLYLYDCPKLVCLPSGLSSLVPLKHLTLYQCTALVSLPDDMFNGSSLSSLCELSIVLCSSLVCLPDDMFKGLTSLRTLCISDCGSLEKIPTSVTECTSLENLTTYGCESVKHPIPDLSKLQGLVDLYIRDVTSSVLEWIPHLPHLQYLEADVEHEIESRDNSPSHSPSTSTRCMSYLTVFCNDNHHTITPPPHKPNNSLIKLELSERSKNKQQKMKSLPQQLLQLHLPNLKILGLFNFEELERLPEWIGTLSSLEELELWYCKNLRHLPAKRHLPQNLKEIIIRDCPILKERIRDKEDGPDSGSEWHKISHVPCIQIDWRSIQDLKNW